MIDLESEIARIPGVTAAVQRIAIRALIEKYQEIAWDACKKAAQLPPIYRGKPGYWVEFDKTFREWKNKE